ncbi:hypothetical protein MHH_c26830 [Mannheimia haemolytica M42548]|nr:hypothetical protein MHH_c26830 [Mannheimia haemolytica M42548]
MSIPILLNFGFKRKQILCKISPFAKYKQKRPLVFFICGS